MPELPEVETIKNQISQFLPLVIDSVSYSDVIDSILKKDSIDFDPSKMTIDKMDRHGKALIFQLNDSKGENFFIISHLGMTGNWRISNAPLSHEKHIHLTFHCLGKYLSYVDPRRFGKIHFFRKDRAKKYLEKIGIDVSSHEFNFNYLYQTLKEHPKRQIKPFLLDQKFFAGVGNYIACEICARAGIRPTRRCGKVTKLEIEGIIKATESVLKGSLSTQGLTFSGGYKDAFGNPGNGVENLVVFSQKRCGICHRESIKKITLAQRGTYYCPYCQK